MAAVSAIATRHAPAAVPASDGGSRLAARLQAGEVAVPVTLVPAARRIAQPGDRVDLYATPDRSGSPAPAGPIGTRLVVLSVSAAEGGVAADEATMVVASDRATALRIAAHGGRPLLAVLDK